MTDFERRIKTRMIEDEYAEKFHQLHSYAGLMKKEYNLEQRWKLKRIF